MTTSLWPRSLALVGALAFGLLTSSIGSSGCLAPDYCIVFPTTGTDWCGSLSGAMMWPMNDPGAAEAILSDDAARPRGCVCMNDGEVEFLQAGVPAEDVAALTAEIEAAARQACTNMVPEGYDHNCDALDEVTLDPVIPGGSSDECFGSCRYAPDPPFGEPCGDPDPWECNDEDPPGTGETGGDDSGGDETGGTTGLGPISDGRLPL